MSMMKEKAGSGVRIYIVEEHDSVRRALVDRLGRVSSLTVIGRSGQAGVVLEQIREEQADLVLIEVKRSDGMGLEIVRQVSSLPCQPCVVVLTSYPSSWEKEAAFRAGASQYLLKDIAPDELIAHIHQAIEEIK
jgi:two-component system, NarL family, nitrate/nitrite response regulator NarL